MQFRAKINIVALVLFIVSISLTIGITYQEVKEQLIADNAETTQVAALGIEKSIKGKLKEKKELATMAVGLISKAEDFDEITEALRSATIIGNFILAGYSDENNHYTFSDQYRSVTDGWNATARPWYQLAKREGKIVYTAPYADSTTKEMVVSIAAPVYEGRDYEGSVFFDVSLKELADHINSISASVDAKAVMFTPKGIIVSHPNQKLNGSSLSNILSLPSHNEGVYETLYDGKDALVTVKTVTDKNWKVALIKTEKSILAPVKAMLYKLLLITGVCLAVTAIFIVVILKRLMAPLGELDGALRDLASGDCDLTRTIPEDTDIEFSKMAKNVNVFNQTLRDEVTLLKSIGEESSNGARSVIEISETNNNRVTEQMAELEQLATAMNEMSASSGEVATSAQLVSSSMADADNSVQEGLENVKSTAISVSDLSSKIDQAVIEVTGLQRSAVNINTVLEVINDIAEQTNLLALNAAIEAARAGEYGRGFAVVADEVRSLAQRTQESTTEIRDIIEELQAGTGKVSTVMDESKVSADSSVETAEQAKSKLEVISATIREISDMNIQIATAAEEQSLVAEEINNNTFKIKELSQEVSSGSEHASNLMSGFGELAEKQNALLAKFKV